MIQLNVDHFSLMCDNDTAHAVEVVVILISLLFRFVRRQ